jgi:HEAT repeat protein
LAAVKNQSAAEPLKAMVRNVGETSQLRMAAARGLGELHDSGLIDLARELAAQESQPPSLHPILATQLLSHHSDSGAVELLTKLLEHENSVVQSEALAQLYRIDFNLVDERRDQLVNSRDVNVRRWCLKALVDKKQADRVELICGLLDDVNPNLRRDSAASLISLAQDAGLRDAVIEGTSKLLGQSSWRGCEQACVVLTRLDHKPSGERMVELLGHERGEVQVAAAWGLSNLRIAELLPDMLEHAQSIYDGFKSEQLNDSTPGVSLHVAHLFIAFGDQTYGPAEGLMKEYLPKDHALGFESRAAAAWAIGLLHEGDPQPDLVSFFVGRLYDNNISPDTEEMRDMSAVSLGRMKAESALPDLRMFAKQGMRSCYWAVEQLTGEKPPVPTADTIPVDDWFLAPLPNRE